MTNQLTPFKFHNHQLRVEVADDGEPLFHVGDLCALLGHSNPRQAVAQHVESDDVTKRDVIDALGRKQLANWVREPGMWSLVLGSHAPNAKPIKRWVTAEVLPSIRKTGRYDLAEKTSLETQVATLTRRVGLLETDRAAIESQVKALRSEVAAEPVMPPMTASWRSRAS